MIPTTSIRGTARHFSPVPTDPNQFIDDVQAAQLLHVSLSFLRKLRLTGGGCKFHKLGRAVRYRLGDLLEWADARATSSTSQPGAV